MGEKELSVELAKGNECFNRSIKLIYLINRLIGGFDFMCEYIKEKYDIDIQAKEDSLPEEFSTAEEKEKHVTVNKYKNLINDIY